MSKLVKNEAPEFTAFMGRILRSFGRRATTDTELLKAMCDLRAGRHHQDRRPRPARQRHELDPDRCRAGDLTPGGPPGLGAEDGARAGHRDPRRGVAAIHEAPQAFWPAGLRAVPWTSLAVYGSRSLSPKLLTPPLWAVVNPSDEPVGGPSEPVPQDAA